MNPFLNTEFWLSLSFFVVLGLIILPPIRKKLKKMLLTRSQKIENRIRETNTVLKEAQTLRKKVSRDLNIKLNDNELKQKLKVIRHEFSLKEQSQKKAKLQDSQVRQNLISLQLKNNLRQSLLDKAEKKILHPKKNSSSQELAHFIKILRENEDALKNALENIN